MTTNGKLYTNSPAWVALVAMYESNGVECPGTGKMWEPIEGRAVCPSCRHSAKTLGASRFIAPRQWQELQGQEVSAHRTWLSHAEAEERAAEQLGWPYGHPKRLPEEVEPIGYIVTS